MEWIVISRLAGRLKTMVRQAVKTRKVKGSSPRNATIPHIIGPFEAGRDQARRTHRGHPMPSVIVITSAHWSNFQYSV
ncbi:hypothetical protein DBL05_04970 [Pseudomonas putida]|nr:hypothetical protein DBL05_04970 [Pseudomonas putida]